MSFKISVNMSLVIIFKIFCFWTCNFWQCWTFINLFSNCVNNIISYITITLFKFSTLSSALIFVLFITLVKDVFFLISSNFYSSSKFNIKIFPSLSELVMTSNVPDSLSGSGSGQILPFLSDTRIRPDLDMKKKSRSGSGRILIWKNDPDPVPAGSWF